ncbi:DUF4079 domain-containing protein [cf. Phormidesmis sp. LEGE 11477]|uniref:DUF4079 domain-containing protein n=1 Tax=cf. Phormidesmis sp. LEGE 11477 TaxID=1828680 RepID=UPI00187F12A7|nr:DUF4079 domain-containing protein [cf. Phormidesmis sp. LEGE 11477]
MDLPSFIWLWRIAAWSMGFSITAYLLLAISGAGLFYTRSDQRLDQRLRRPSWLRSVHFTTGILMVLLVLLLLSIGIIGTLGEFGHLGHSLHLPAGLFVVVVTLVSAWSATRINPERPWARTLHLSLNAVLLFAFVAVTASGWSVVQKYL